MPALETVARSAGGGRHTASRRANIDSSVRTSALGNLTGLTALSVPCGFSGAGLPIGLQVIGKPLREAEALAVGAAWERLNPTAGRMPHLP
ncbi:MAG: amidase family protein [Austwickia sp.]|nr:hypothetical protein [Actinomycetota bacterium]MCB1251744.1 hypothetical protein [Austwickia sp.]MCO5308515.1 amidase family protein [Austwickia sp.]